jgi:hypothetical protein
VNVVVLTVVVLSGGMLNVVALKYYFVVQSGYFIWLDFYFKIQSKPFLQKNCENSQFVPSFLKIKSLLN